MRTLSPSPIALARHIVAIVTLALGASACSEAPVVRACTEIGCNDGIFLTIETEDGQPVDSFAGEVTVADTSLQVTCADGAGGGDGYLCVGNSLQLQQTEGDEIALDIRSADDQSLGFVGTIPLAFEETQPNGEGCPPVCRQAHHTVQLSDLTP